MKNAAATKEQSDKAKSKGEWLPPNKVDLVDERFVTKITSKQTLYINMGSNASILCTVSNNIAMEM